MAENRRRPTIKDIARIAGTTHSTVSRVINGSPLISSAMKEKVERLLKKLNYRPNLIARGLVRRKTRAFALVVPDINPHVQPVIRGVADVCRKHDYGLMLFSTDYWADENQYFLEVAKNWLVDGILIYNVVYRKDVSEAAKALEKERMPHVFINKYLGAGRVNAVSIDNRDAVFKIVKHLKGLGHSRIGMINGSMISVDGVERHEAFREVLGEYGLKYDESITGDANFSGDEAYAVMKRIMASRRPPTAVFCANDLMATGAVKAARELGLKVPADLSVAGFDDWEGARFFDPPLTTVRPPLEDIGPLAIDLLLEIIRNPDRKPEQIGLKAEFIPRASTSAPRLLKTR